MFVVRYWNIYLQKYLRTFFLTTKIFQSQNVLLHYYALFDTLKIPVQRNPRYGDGIEGFWTKSTFAIFLSRKIVLCMCKCQNTCFSVDTVRNAPHLRVQHPSIRVLKGRHGIAEHSLDRRETG